MLFVSLYGVGLGGAGLGGDEEHRARMKGVVAAREDAIATRPGLREAYALVREKNSGVRKVGFELVGVDTHEIA